MQITSLFIAMFMASAVNASYSASIVDIRPRAFSVGAMKSGFKALSSLAKAAPRITNSASKIAKHSGKATKVIAKHSGAIKKNAIPMTKKHGMNAAKQFHASGGTDMLMTGAAQLAADKIANGGQSQQGQDQQQYYQ